MRTILYFFITTNLSSEFNYKSPLWLQNLNVFRNTAPEGKLISETFSNWLIILHILSLTLNIKN